MSTPLLCVRSVASCCCFQLQATELTESNGECIRAWERCRPSPRQRPRPFFLPSSNDGARNRLMTPHHTDLIYGFLDLRGCSHRTLPRRRRRTCARRRQDRTENRSGISRSNTELSARLEARSRSVAQLGSGRAVQAPDRGRGRPKRLSVQPFPGPPRNERSTIDVHSPVFRRHHPLRSGSIARPAGAGLCAFAAFHPR